MSTAHLKGKLLANLQLIGVTADEVKEMTRAALLDAMANLYVILKQQVGPDDPLSEDEENVELESAGQELESEPEQGLAIQTVTNPDVEIQLTILKLQLKMQREKHKHKREMKDRDLEIRRMEARSQEQLKHRLVVQ